jgi:single-strand DNA-binding protein
MAVVSGRLQLRDWTDREGNKHRSAEVVANSVYFGESKKDRDEASYEAAEHAGKVEYDEADEDGELPF